MKVQSKCISQSYFKAT